MVYGNVVAIAQRDVKRMLGYSSIGHTGYMLAGLAAFTSLQPGDHSRNRSGVAFAMITGTPTGP